MKKAIYTYIFIASLLCSFSLQANNEAKIDSLQKVLPATSGKEKVNTLISLSYKHQEKDLNKSVAYANDAIKEAEKLKDSVLLAECITTLGIAYDYAGSYDTAMQQLIRALEIYEIINNDDGKAHVLNNIGSVFFYQRNFEKATQYWEQAIAIKRKNNNPKEYAGTLNNLAVAYVRMQKYDEASSYYEQVIAIYSELKNYKNLAAAYNNMGILLHKKNGNGKESEAYYLKALSIYDSLNLPLGKSETLLNLGAVYYEQNLHEKAINNFLESLKISTEIGAAAHKKQAYANLSETYETKGDFANALKYYKLHYELKDSVMNENSQKQIAELEKKYESEKKERQIELQQLELIKSENRLYQFITVGGILLMFLALWAGYFYQRRKANEALEKAKSKFFSNIVHEFRTPVTLITGPIEQAIEQTNQKPVQDMLHMAQRNSQQLLKLVNQLLDVSKIESGKMQLNKSYGNFAEFSGEIINYFQPLAQQKNIRLSFHNHLTDSLFFFDKDALEKVLFNLLSNAVKFTQPQGNITVTLQQTTNILQITVADSGIGIAAKDLKHIFERFYKSEENNKQGTGIGLSLVKDLITLHGGTIQVKSEKTLGTTFTIELPFEAKAAAENFVTETNEENISDENPNILIVEDNAEMVEYINSILKKENYTITKASNGKEGLHKAQLQIPDIVITDLMMPDMDGNELTATLKSNIATNHIPVVMLTAKVSLTSKIEGLEKGADAYLTKPFAAKELVLQIKNLLATQKRLHEAYQRSNNNEAAHIANEVKPSVLNTNDKFVQQVIEQILLRLSDENFSIEELAEKVFLSRTQLHRKLKAITGLTASQLMRTVRLEKAMVLLQTNAANVTEAAYQTGFSSQSYFTKCFIEHFGFAPSEVKKSH